MARERVTDEAGNPSWADQLVEIPFNKLVSDDNNRVVHTALRDYCLRNRRSMPTRQALATKKATWFGHWLDSHRLEDVEPDSLNRVPGKP